MGFASNITFEVFEKLPSLVWMSAEESLYWIIEGHYKELKRRQERIEFEEALKRVSVAFEDYKKRIESRREEL